MGRRGYSAEFRRRVVDLVAAGRKVADVARDLGISDQTIYLISGDVKMRSTAAWRQA